MVTWIIIFTMSLYSQKGKGKLKKITFKICNSMPNFYWVNDFNNWFFESNGIKGM